jgi:adenylate cyclase class IV
MNSITENNMYEVEYKVEITKAERDALIATLNKDGFISRDTVTQNDYYVEVTNLPGGGYDFRRYRDEGKRAFYTVKTWETTGGQKRRLEEEKEISRAELLSEVEKYPDKLKITKDRQSFSGKYQNTELHIDMDSVKFDHSPVMRYFVEAEVLTEDQAEVPIMRSLIISFLKTALGREDIAESPGMFNMAFNKL